MKLICKVFTETEEKDKSVTNGYIVYSPQWNFNHFDWENKNIHSMQALADQKGICKSIVVWYEEIVNKE